MKNKLHIFGCSHSTDYACENDKWWGKFLTNFLKLDLYPTHGQSGKNIEFILLDIYDRMLNGKISKDDVVVFNTSYPLRFGSPRLQQFSYPNGPSDIPTDSLKKTLYSNFDKKHLNDSLSFDLWYKQTYASYQILSSVCNNVYQWTLETHTYLDKIYIDVMKKIHNEDEYFNSIYNMSNYPTPVSKYDDIKKNNWEKLLNHPSEYDSWNSFIAETPISLRDEHMHPSRHIVFAKNMYNEILNYK